VGDDMASFGELLSEIRRDRHMTQKDLAEVLHVSTGTISNYEKDVHLPDVDKLISIADYFNVTTDYLLGRTSYNVSPDVFETVVLNDKPAYEVLENFKILSQEQRKAIGIVLDDMCFRAEIIQSSYPKKRGR
jgi:transcriptional regulator with XRE-family HTH domain